MDTTSRKVAGRFLEQCLELWQEKEHPRGDFCVDLMEHPAAHTDDNFRWTHYLNSTPWGRDIVLDVCYFYLVWLEDKERPGFGFCLTCGVSGTIDTLGSGRARIKWDPNADEVS